jgi:hypothetical protein
VIWDNGIYQINGKQQTAAAVTTDIVAVAKGAGIANSHWEAPAAAALDT